MEALVMKVETDKSLLLQLYVPLSTTLPLLLFFLCVFCFSFLTSTFRPSGITFTVSPHQSEVQKVKKGDVVTFAFDNFRYFFQRRVEEKVNRRGENEIVVRETDF